MSVRNLFLTCLVLFFDLALSAGEPVFENGKTDWKIYVSPKAEATEKYAAEELRNALKKISGADFEIVAAEKAPESKAIILGDLKNPEVLAQAKALKLEPDKVETVAVYTLGNRLYLAGNNPRGALYAVYSFLQRELGVRWLWPGADGEFMPPKTSWTPPELAFNHKPAIQYRGLHLCGQYREPESGPFLEWMARNFLNIYRHAAGPEEKKKGFYSMWSGHNVDLPAKLFKEHPEYFAEIKGKRYASQPCLSNPEVLKFFATNFAANLRKKPYLDIMSIFLADNQDYCRCEACAKMDVSTAWFEFYNKLTDILKKEFPDMKFSTLAYQGYRNVPKCAIRNSEFVEYCSYSRCNIHPYGQADCKSNEKTMQEFLAWKTTGCPIGNYAYENDVVFTNRRFSPSLSIIDDAVKTNRKLGNVAMIPEVSLVDLKHVVSDEYIYQFQSRLPYYLYARLMWEPNQKMTDILRDWCEKAFGVAAAPMYDYYLSMDHAWSTMPTHAGILGDALRFAPLLLASKLPAQASSSFASAEKCLLQITEPSAQKRVEAAITRERILFKQWQDLYYSTQSDLPRFNLPRQTPENAAEQYYSRPQSFSGSEKAANNTDTTLVSLAWTKEALLVKWDCRVPEIGNLKAFAIKHDSKVLEDDSVELVLSDGLSGETWHFAANSKGIRQDFRDSKLGVRDDQWNPDWQLKTAIEAKVWRTEMTIPFASLGRTPNPNENWQARFVRHNGARKDIANSVFPADNMALLLFSSAARTDQRLLWWSGRPEQESSQDAGLKVAMTKAGWEMQLIGAVANPSALSDSYDAYWFRHPNGPNKVPSEYWGKYFAPAVKNGALAVFCSYNGIPLEEYFNDPSLKTTVKGTNAPLAARRSKFIAPGDWSLKPNDLSSLKHCITPAYGFIPEDPSAWTILASAPRKEANESFPYILAKSYGKGMIVLCGVEIAVPASKMLENFIEYNRQRIKEK